MNTLTLAVGHLNLPTYIQESVGTTTVPFEQTAWTFGKIISIICFVLKPPTFQSTLAKHVLKIVPSASAAERELAMMLASSLLGDSQQQRFGIAELKHHKTAILSASDGTGQFVLHIVESEHHRPGGGISYLPGVVDYPVLAPDTLVAQPLRILKLCEQWPHSSDDLKALATEIRGVADLYGYEDMWSVLKGICAKFQIETDQLLLTS